MCRQILENPNYRQIFPLGVPLFHADRLPNMTKLMAAFRKCLDNVHKNAWLQTLKSNLIIYVSPIIYFKKNLGE
jgi:hypothetical protein